MTEPNRSKFYPNEATYGVAIANNHLTCEWELKNDKMEVKAFTDAVTGNKTAFVTLMKLAGS